MRGEACGRERTIPSNSTAAWPQSSWQSKMRCETSGRSTGREQPQMIRPPRACLTQEGLGHHADRPAEMTCFLRSRQHLCCRFERLQLSERAGGEGSECKGTKTLLGGMNLRKLEGCICGRKDGEKNGYGLHVLVALRKS